MKVNSTEKREKKEKDPHSSQLSSMSVNLSNIVKEKELNELTYEEIDSLTVDDLEFLRQKYQIEHPKPTIIGKVPYDPFLAGITDDNWMSTGDRVKED
ncbi:hypothetical protein LCGC14_1401790 [marine sediment metagenome]|uniref:Uncharacterized protein n=1 Tax=marine sediment metagenome TaxID=412755 RepID=A0A0F9KHW1_9ZZZZ